MKSNWSDIAAKKFQTAFDEWKARRPRARLHLVWGHANKDDQEFGEFLSNQGFESVEALLSNIGLDYPMRISQSGDHERPDNLSITLSFTSVVSLPTENKQLLYEALRALQDGVHLILAPDPDDGSGFCETIYATGCEVHLYVDHELSAKTLAAAVENLTVSRNAIWELLSHS